MKPGEVDKPNADVVGRIPSEACDSREQTGTAQKISEWLFSILKLNDESYFAHSSTPLQSWAAIASARSAVRL
jgi:hypothetical protein